jgi:uncharacterized protein YehS (DUF1456 family)
VVKGKETNGNVTLILHLTLKHGICLGIKNTTTNFMNNNDILRRIRYTFEFNDDKMMEIFALAGYPATRAEISDWLKKDDNPEQKSLHDKYLAIFLNGLIINNRGKREGPPPKPEKSLNNNLIFRKLKIALNLRDTDILEIFDLAEIRISKHEINAFFRKPGQRQYRECKDQFLRNFIYGMQIKYRKE